MTNRSRRRRLVLVAMGLVTLAILVAGCGPDNRQNSLQPKGPDAQKIDDLFMPVVVAAAIIFILVAGAVVYSAVKYRQRPGRVDRPRQVHGNTTVEIGWTLLPAVILAVIAVPTVSLIFELNEPAKANALEVRVVAKQWWWQFDYPATNGGTKVVTADELHIPIKRQVHVTLTACDASLPGGCNVIHSFWVPELNGKRDVVPGHENTLTFSADKPGVYLGQCAEYCGLSHANMRFRVIAQTQGDFDDWLSGQQEGPAVTVQDAGRAGQLFTDKFQCTNCHTTEDPSVSTYGPNLTHLRSRTTFASGYYPLDRANLVEWILNAPGMIPMESQDCRKGLGAPGVTCVGMPSFTLNTPPGDPTMTREEAELIADYLLELK